MVECWVCRMQAIDLELSGLLWGLRLHKDLGFQTGHTRRGGGRGGLKLPFLEIKALFLF